MIIPNHIAKKLLHLLRGDTLPASSVKHSLIEEMIAEGIIERKGRIQKTLSIFNKSAFQTYLKNKFGINDLEQYILTIKQENVSRSELVEISASSKLKKTRTFKGFLTNCFSSIQATINGKLITLNPTAGTFLFIYDFESFTIPRDVTIIGVENPENFRYIEKQKYLFENITPLFVSRYPQNQNRDMIKWLLTISNPYIHFGDFDFSSIGIYLYEYKKYLENRASFFIPENIELLIETYGNKELYDVQNYNLIKNKIEEEKILHLIDLIHKNRKGLEQEILINKKPCPKLKT